jgi:hypothetical protein
MGLLLSATCWLNRRHGRIKVRQRAAVHSNAHQLVYRVSDMSATSTSSTQVSAMLWLLPLAFVDLHLAPSGHAAAAAAEAGAELFLRCLDHGMSACGCVYSWRHVLTVCAQYNC